jgi:type 1 glutamine amidotransferase
MKKWITLIALLVCGGSSPGLLPAAAGQEGARPHVVFLIGEDEYKTDVSLPAFARAELEPAGLKVTIIHASKDDPNDFPGMVKALAEADLVLVSVRRRTPPGEQLDALRAYLDRGKPLVGIRTACHAFALRPKDKLAPGRAQWQDFDPQVIGGHYVNHHGAGPRTAVTVAPGTLDHAILRGVDATRLQGNGSLYRVSPLEPGTTPLLIGTIPGKDPEPIAWTHTYGPRQARVFYTSLGHIEDFGEPPFRRLMVNAILWALGR